MNDSEIGEKGSIKGAATLFLVTLVIPVMIIYALDHTEIFPRFEEEQTPTIGAVRTFCGPTVHIDKVDPGPVNINKTSYYVLDPNGTVIEELGYSFIDIRNVGLTNETNITYYDNDDDWKLSAGDVIDFCPRRDGGLVYDDCALVIVYEPTGKKMNGAGTKL